MFQTYTYLHLGKYNTIYQIMNILNVKKKCFSPRGSYSNSGIKWVVELSPTKTAKSVGVELSTKNPPTWGINN